MTTFACCTSSNFLQRRKMTQKANLFKGQQKKKSVPPNSHGKPSVTRKGNYLVLRVCVFCLWKSPVLDSMCICFFLFWFVQGRDLWSRPKSPRRWMLIVYVPFSILFPNAIFIFSQIFRGLYMLGMLWFRLMGYVMWKCKWGQLNFVVIDSYEVGLSKSAY